MQNKRRMAFFGYHEFAGTAFSLSIAQAFLAHVELSYRAWGSQFQANSGGMFIITHCWLNPNWSIVTVKY